MLFVLRVCVHKVNGRICARSFFMKFVGCALSSVHGGRNVLSLISGLHSLAVTIHMLAMWPIACAQVSQRWKTTTKTTNSIKTSVSCRVHADADAFPLLEPTRQLARKFRFMLAQVQTNSPEFMKLMMHPTCIDSQRCHKNTEIFIRSPAFCLAYPQTGWLLQPNFGIRLNILASHRISQPYIHENRIHLPLSQDLSALICFTRSPCRFAPAYRLIEFQRRNKFLSSFAHKNVNRAISAH